MKTNLKLSQFLVLTSAACVAVCVTACHQKSTANEVEPPPDFQREGNVVIVPEKSALRSRLVIDKSCSESVRRVLSVPATIEADPRRYSRIFPPVGGRVATLHVQLGDAVTNGQLLATLHSPDFMQAQGDFIKARSALEISRKQLDREKDLLEHKIAAVRDVEQAQGDFDAARTTLDSAASRLRAYGVDPDKDSLGQHLQLRSPLTGRVVDMASGTGEFHNDNTTPIMTVADLSVVWLAASVQEKDLRFVAKGQSVRASLPAYPGETFTGEVQSIGDLLDPDTRVVKVRMAVSNPNGRLKPGMFATVDLIDFPEKQVTVPASAVLQIGDSTVVYEQVQPWRFEPREVVLGAHQGDRVVVLKGLAENISILSKEGVLFQQ